MSWVSSDPQPRKGCAGSLDLAGPGIWTFPWVGKECPRWLHPAIPHWLLPQPAVTPEAVMKPVLHFCHPAKGVGCLNRGVGRSYPAPVPRLEEPALPLGSVLGTWCSGACPS